VTFDPLYLDPGSLRASITVETPSVSGDAFGSAGGTWDAILNTRASIQAISQREQTQDAQTVAQVTHIIKIRYPGSTVAITAGCRVWHGTACFNIQTVENIQDRNRVIKMMCVAVDGSSLITNRTGDGTPVVSNTHPLTAADIPNIAESQVTGLVADLANLAANGGSVAQVNADWNAASGAAKILNKPTIPSVPTVVSAFTNDNGYVTSATAPVRSVAGRGGAVVLAESDVANLVSDLASKQPTLGFTPENAANKGTASGYPSLDSTGHIPLNQLPASVQGAMYFAGVWNASTNSPTITSGFGILGQFYKISVAGNTQVDGASAWHPGDWIVYTGANWDKVDNYENVSSVAGRTGNVTLTAPDVSGLATVATSGSYNDLSGKPTIPAAQVNSDWNAVSGVAQLLNKPTLAAVATSGSYNDLSNKPAISTKRVNTQTAVTTISINSDTCDVIYATVTASSGTLTVSADTGTGQTEGRSILLKINCVNSMTFSLPTGTKGIYGGLVGLPVNTSGGGKTDIFSLYWDATTSHWLFMGQGLGF